MHQKIREYFGSDESTSLELVTDMYTGRSYIKLEKSVRQTFETKDLKKAKLVFEKITGGNGRQLYKPEDMV